jgi:hypothetical protein
LKICARSVERVVRSITSRYVASIDLKIYATLLKLIKLLV